MEDLVGGSGPPRGATAAEDNWVGCGALRERLG